MFFRVRRPVTSALSRIDCWPIQWLRDKVTTSVRSPSDEHVAQPSRSWQSYTAAEDDAIIRGRDEGLTWRQIASRVNRSHSSVQSRFQHYLSLSPRNRPKERFKLTEDAFILQGRRNRETWDAIAANINRTAESVRRRFYNMVPTSERNEYETRNLFSPAEDLVILRLRDNEHRSYRYIARELGRSLGSVRGRYEDLISPLSSIDDEKDRITVSGEFSGFADSEIIRLRQQQNWHLRDVARRLGRTHRSVRRRYKDRLSDNPPRNRRKRILFNKIEDTRLLELRNAGLSWSAISSLFPDRSPHSLRGRWALLIDRQTWSKATEKDKFSLIWA